MTNATTIRHPGSAPRWLPAVVLASGFAGLGYEMVWTRMLAVSLGHEIIAVLAVLAAFFAGLALGASALGARLRHSRRPHRWYAGLELVIGLWALALVWLMPLFNALVPGWIGEEPSAVMHWGLAFGLSFLLLLPATAAMGATLPALERVYVGVFGVSKHVGSVYAANTFGAVAGTALTTFLLIPALGNGQTLMVCAALNLLCALAVVRLPVRTAETPASPTRSSGPQPRVLMILLMTGFLGLSYEVLVIRVLSQVLEDTVFTFAIVLSVYLLGTALGAAAYQARLAHRATQETTARLLIVASTAALTGLAVLWAADLTYDRISRLFELTTAGALVGEVALALAVFLLPTAAMGALFTHLAQQATPRYGLGLALGSNTLGAAIAPLIAGVLILPAIGAKWALLLVALGYLMLLGDGWRRVPRLTGIAVMIVLGLALMPSLRFVEIPNGGRLLDYRDGVMAATAVVEDARGVRHLKVNNRFTMGSTASGFADHRQTHLPLLLHPQPRSALFLGIGTGMSLNAARFHPRLQVTGVDLLPESLALLPFFGTAPTQNDWAIAPRLLPSDARRFVVSSPRRFDVIIADLFHPSRDGAGALYTAEHFEAVKQGLAPGGLFCQWLPLFQMDLDTFKLIARTFVDRFPYAQVHLPHYSLRQPVVGLIGANEPLAFAPGWLDDSVDVRALGQQLAALRLDSDLALFGGFLGEREALAHYVGPGPLNTDDRPLVTYRAPGFAYRREQGHGERLVELAEALADRRGTLLRPSATVADRRFEERLTAYWHARDVYLRAGLGVDPNDDLQTLLAKTRAPLLEALRISADFTPAYRPLLSMAQALEQRDPAAARQLLEELDLIVPGRDRTGRAPSPSRQ